ncbi:substrate-binding domain-containing protein [Microlunatus soli]|uniref:4,5-dihydroxyphthalate decarboxylase n=1 Tax=Microlunatus soli TaxID=630515 RepID=A0A1H1YM15_9ACTN|nr:hypothetical protein [Microlunatus soli]SDT22507.1 4,5-dihydroxyphthalate decarboxylase [Microlunatus soli]
MSDTRPQLRAAFGNHPIGDVLRSGAVDDPRVRLAHEAVSPIHKAFAPMVTDQAYDVSELAIVTGLQAIGYDHPITLMPVVLAARFQRGCLVTRSADPIDARHLRGRRVGVRAYTQTTGFWVRTHLAEDYRIASQDVAWVTQNPAHVPEYQDPTFVERTLRGSLEDALRAGQIDAAIFGNDLPVGDEFVPVIDRPDERDREWFGANGYAPINHLVAVSTSVIDAHPEAVVGALDLLVRAEELAAGCTDGARLTMSGLERLRGPVDAIARACYDQGMLPRPLSSDEVFGPITDLLAQHS